MLTSHRCVLDKERTVDLWGKLLHSWDYGIYRATLDGQELEVMDLYNQSVTPTSHRWKERRLTAGEHALRFECVGKNDKSKGYFFGFDALVARIAAYTRPAGFDLRRVKQ